MTDTTVIMRLRELKAKATQGTWYCQIQTSIDKEPNSPDHCTGIWTHPMGGPNNLVAFSFDTSGADWMWMTALHNESDSLLADAERCAELEVLYEQAVKDCNFYKNLAESRVRELEAKLGVADADLEISMDALDKLAYPTTLGPATLAHLGEAGENEVRLRAEFAHEQRQRTAQWKRAAKECEEQEAAELFKIGEA